MCGAVELSVCGSQKVQRVRRFEKREAAVEEERCRQAKRDLINIEVQEDERQRRQFEGTSVL